MEMFLLLFVFYAYLYSAAACRGEEGRKIGGHGLTTHKAHFFFFFVSSVALFNMFVKFWCFNNF